MKLAAVIIKTLKENIRDWKILVIVLIFSPFFIFVMKLFYGGESTTYKIGILDLDGRQAAMSLKRQLSNYAAMEGKLVFDIVDLNGKDTLISDVNEKRIDLGIIIPKDYTDRLQDVAYDKKGTPAIVEFYGSLGNSRYMLSSAAAWGLIQGQGLEAVKVMLPAEIRETFTEKKIVVNEFDGFVPGLISMGVLMVLFSASASFVREDEKKTLIRLKLSNVGAFNLLLGISIVQAVIAVAATMLSYWTALGLGYKPVGKFGPVLFVAILTSLSMMPVSLITAAFLKSAFDVATVGCFPFFILLFFSGCMFPLPGVRLFSIAGHIFNVFDILPLTHASTAFGKILNSGAGIADVLYELSMILLLTVIYFMIGLLLYRKRKLSRA